jgi:hypothetical protein
MANDALIKREARRGRAMFETLSEGHFRDQTAWRDAKKREALASLFPSCQPGGRGATSPLDGRSPGVWSGTPEGKS